MRSSSIGTTTTQPITYSLDNLSIFYSYPYTVENCDNLADGYRFGFNGQEKESDIYGESNVYEFKFRIHHARTGRFLSQEPLFKEYPWNSPYAFAENDVIRSMDLEGLEKAIAIRFFSSGVHYKTTMIQVPDAERIRGSDNQVIIINVSPAPGRGKTNLKNRETRTSIIESNTLVNESNLTPLEQSEFSKLVRIDGDKGQQGFFQETAYSYGNSEVQFPTDVADVKTFRESLTPSQRENFRKLSALINSGDEPNITINVVGNTSNRPTRYQSDGSVGELNYENNIPLSQDRANAASQCLQEDFGIPVRNINAVGIGSTNPKTSDPTSNENQRVEIKAF